MTKGEHGGHGRNLVEREREGARVGGHKGGG